MERIKEIILDTAEETLGRKKGKKAKPWLSSQVFELSAQKKKARISNDTKQYKKLKSEIQRKVRADKRVWLEEQCQLIGEYDRKHKSKAMFKQIKKAKKKTINSSQLPIKNKNKETLIEKEEIMCRWREYGQDLFCLPEGDTQIAESVDPPPILIPPEPPPLLDEVEDAIKSLSRGKSPGLDNLPAELIKASDTFGKKMHSLTHKENLGNM